MDERSTSVIPVKKVGKSKENKYHWVVMQSFHSAQNSNIYDCVCFCECLSSLPFQLQVDFSVLTIANVYEKAHRLKWIFYTESYSPFFFSQLMFATTNLTSKQN